MKLVAIILTLNEAQHLPRCLASLTGVRAALINGNANSGMVFTSEGFGSDSFVSVQRLQAPDPTVDSWDTFRYNNNASPDLAPPFNWADVNLISATRDSGQDVSALVNGSLATGRGLEIKVNSGSISADLTLTQAFAQRPYAANSTFTITGGGALFQLGQDVTALQQANLGIPSVAASNLGGVRVGAGLEFLSSLKSGQTNSISASVRSGNFTTASDILGAGIDEISILRGRLGAFERNVLETNTRSLNSALENLTASASQIRDADFAFETSQLTRAQILSSSGTSVLGLANQQSQQVLQLLQG